MASRSKTRSAAASLADQLLAPPRVDALREDSLRLLEHRVQHSPGIKGMALRSGLALLKSTRADLLPRGVARLLPVFVDALEPYYAEWRTQPSGADFSAFLLARRDSVVDALMGSADDLAAASQHATARSVYARIRSAIRHEVTGALPTLARRIDRELTSV